MDTIQEYLTGEREYPVTKKKVENDDDYSCCDID